MSTELMAKLDALAGKAPESRHSYFQLKYFLLGKEPTVQGRLWACLREIESRREALRAMVRQEAETQDQIALNQIEGMKLTQALRKAEADPSTDPNVLPLLRKESEVRLRQLNRVREGLEEQLTKLARSKRFAEQEARFFVQAYESLEKLEPLKDYDDLKAQMDYWNHKVAEDINLKMLLQRPLDPDIVKMALSLPDECPIKGQTAQTLQHVERQMLEMKKAHMQRLEARKNNAEHDIDADAGV